MSEFDDTTPPELNEVPTPEGTELNVPGAQDSQVQEVSDQIGAETNYINPNEVTPLAEKAVSAGGKAWIWWTVAGVITTLVIAIGGLLYFYQVKGPQTSGNTTTTSSTTGSSKKTNFGINTGLKAVNYSKAELNKIATTINNSLYTYWDVKSGGIFSEVVRDISQSGDTDVQISRNHESVSNASFQTATTVYEGHFEIRHEYYIGDKFKPLQDEFQEIDGDNVKKQPGYKEALANASKFFSAMAGKQISTKDLENNSIRIGYYQGAGSEYSVKFAVRRFVFDIVDSSGAVWNFQHKIDKNNESKYPVEIYVNLDEKPLDYLTGEQLKKYQQITGKSS